MSSLHFLLLFYSLLFNHLVYGQTEKKINILIITGGHDFEREPFFKMFDNFNNVIYREVQHPEALNYLNTDKSSGYEVLVFYDMPSEIANKQKSDFLELAQNGKNMLFLHHSIVSYDGWDEYENLMGGHYYNQPYHKEGVMHPPSEYSHDEYIKVFIEDKEHPVTKGVSDFEIFDETYNNVYIRNEVEPLISTDHPQSNKIIGWINQYKNSKIVYLQPGHGPQIYGNPNYQKLVEQSIRWLAELAD